MTILSASTGLAASVSACGTDRGDDGTATGTAEGDESATTGTTSAVVPTGGSSGTTQDDSTESATAGTTAGTEVTTGGGCEAPQIDFKVLERHITDLTGIAGLVAGHPGPTEAPSFFTAPGFDMSKVAFAGPLVETCSQASMYDAFCEEDHCSQIFCTGLGAGWRVRTWLDPTPGIQGAFTYDSVDVDVTWADGAPGTSFVLTASASRGEEDWSVMGQGTMDLTTMTVEETFPGLVPGASVVLNDTAVEGVHAGGLTVDGVEIAIVTPEGHLQPIVQCP